MPYLKINGIKTAVEAFGDIHNPPLILLFGNATDKAGWHLWEYNNTIQKLAKENYVIVYDRRGHGQTPFESGGLDDLAEDLIALMDTLCLEKANVVGLSAGTYILGRAATLAPERFNSMILIVPHSHSFGGSPATHLMRSMGIDSATATPEQISEFSKVMWAPMTTDETRAKHAAFLASFNHLPDIPLQYTINGYKSIGNFDNRKGYAKLKLPVLVLSGKYDRCNPPEIGKAIAEAIDGGRYVEMPNSSHMMFNEENEAVVEQMLNFLRSVN